MGIDLERKVLVIGAGGAGLAAAAQAAERGAQVVVLEMNDDVGGVTALSTGLIRASETVIQKRLGIKDSRNEDFRELMEYAMFTSDFPRVARMVQNGAAVISWLLDLGVTFQDQMGVMPRTHLILPDGRGLTDTLYDVCKRRGVTFMMKTKASELEVEAGKVIGAKATTKNGEEITLTADATVLCGGGAFRGEVLSKHCPPAIKDLCLSIGYYAGSTGDGFKIAEAVGAEVTDLDKVISNLGIFVDKDLNAPPLGATSALRHAGGAILLNQALQRFCDESRYYVSLAQLVAGELQKRNERWVWEIWDEHCREAVPRVDRYLQLGYCEKGILLVAQTVRELAEKMGADGSKLNRSISRYNQFFERSLKEEQDFGRRLEHLHPIKKPPFYAVRAALEILSTRGGIKTDSEARVLDKGGSHIPNLFAAGDDMGGIHGESYVTGVSLLHGQVYGRIAGDNAATGTLGASVKLSRFPSS